ncbi:MAG: hypothetical protein IT385_28890 [Deltaproteobacteria bacterium]|nr:hypothetical protein [Deltaproteobacteria bacterium]
MWRVVVMLVGLNGLGCSGSEALRADAATVSETEDTSPSRETEDTSPSPETEDASPSPETEDSSPSPETEDASPSPETEDTSPSPETEDASPSPEAEDSSPDDTSPGDALIDDASTEVTGLDDVSVGDASVVVRGRIRIEQRRPNAARDALGPSALAPLAGREVVLMAAGSPLGVVTTGSDGTFSLAIASAPLLPVTATVVAASAVASPDDLPTITVLDGLDTAFPTGPGQPLDSQRVWAWTFTSPSADLGDRTITAAQGSGALTLLADLEAAHARLVALAAANGLIDDATDLPNLAVLWHPSRTPPCLSCYFPAGWGPFRLVDAQGAVLTVFDRGIFLSGANAAPHHWTPSLSGHELGHYALEVLSRLPSSSGAHSWNTRTRPSLAWSEGFATFFAQWSLSAVNPDSRFFTKQQNIEYWVDLERIGTSPSTDDTSLAITFPMPQSTQPMTQDMNEAVIAAILWDLLDPIDDVVDLDTLAHGDEALARVSLPRLAVGDVDRGASGPDLVDYIDALVCFGLTWAELQPEMMGFPWTGPAICPP